MDKQSIHSEVAEFLKSEQGAALVAESLSGHLARNDQVQFVASAESASGESTEQLVANLGRLMGSQELVQGSR